MATKAPRHQEQPEDQFSREAAKDAKSFHDLDWFSFASSRIRVTPCFGAFLGVLVPWWQN
jgi:hypothetical protein